MTKETARSWALEEFGTAELCDARWRTRLIAMAAQAARRPGGKVSQVFNNPAERQGAYGLIESARVSRSEIAQPMFDAGARRCASLPFVYVLLDGSSVTIVDKAGTKEFGRVGDHVHGARGLKVISALLESPECVTLGLGSQIWWRRDVGAAKEDRAKRRTGEKETSHWLEAMDQTRAVMSVQAPRTRRWFQLDREGDAWPILMHADKEGDWFTIRGNHNRRVNLPYGSKTYLRTVINAQPVAGTYWLAVPAGPGRSARNALMVVRACEVTLDFRDKWTKKHFEKTVNVVLASEQGTTPAGEKAIEWMLLTNRPITTIGELMQVVQGYAQRWRIEDFHRTWKSGTCQVEEMELRSADAAEKWATILAAVAVRTERLKLLSRQEPERPASDEFSPTELRAIVLLRFGEQARRKVPEGAVPTLKQAVQWIAEIGGYTGKSSGGPPGSVTISRGLRDVLAVVRALAALEESCDEW